MRRACSHTSKRRENKRVQTMTMASSTRLLPLVSIVFVTFNRIETLRPTVASFLAVTDYPRDRLELVVADDASISEVRAAIREMDFDVFALSSLNRGMGANVNQGLAAASGDYILQLQDDWECVGPADYLRRAVAVMQAWPAVGMVICRHHPQRLPKREIPTIGKDLVRIFDHDPARQVRAVGQHAYTDWPHVKRRTFIEAIGPYKEGRRMWETELDYAQRVNAQTSFFIADIVGLDAFRHIGGGLSYNRGPWTARFSMALERYPIVRPLVALARQFKRRLGDPRDSVTN